MGIYAKAVQALIDAASRTGTMVHIIAKSLVMASRRSASMRLPPQSPRLAKYKRGLRMTRRLDFRRQPSNFDFLVELSVRQMEVLTRRPGYLCRQHKPSGALSEADVSADQAVLQAAQAQQCSE